MRSFVKRIILFNKINPSIFNKQIIIGFIIYCNKQSGSIKIQKY